MKYAFVFPGQGSQKQNMASDFYSCSKLLDTSKNIYPNIENIFKLPDPELSQTENSQPAIFVACSMIWEEINKMYSFSSLSNNAGNNNEHSIQNGHINQADKLQTSDQTTVNKNDTKMIPAPSFFAGHSLGEYSACFASNAINFESGLELIKLRSRLMSKSKGTMFACIGKFDDVQNLCQFVSEKTNKICQIANDNNDTQVVISCENDCIDLINKSYKNFNVKRCIQLKVSGGFHSPLVESVKSELSKGINEVMFNDVEIPVISNKTALPEKIGQKIKDNLMDHVVSGVKWRETIMFMKENGVEKIVEVGGNVLSKISAKLGVDSFSISNKNELLDLESFLNK
ncbi:ACP S-malonyltransferase [Candidatus Nesciobacter abundans]|uniref:Malonyl CoA-acyl carrier protein transacylase n=1 Tax=Candidatus Nesciobacter abundans TaxID=2601668 RepID=A0A5C0UHC5_9PROT|nr:ACP S-malonyltransferase [Candidatus Nesciobacter abundans]QEK39140.1 ACP S-malonyltransferase [Candidatus Nesciobacter abundans]